MSKSLADILGSRWDEPPEIQAIKRYVQQNFDAFVQVTIQPKQIIISADSAALAASLRLHIYPLQQAVKTDKRLVIRISQQRR